MGGGQTKQLLAAILLALLCTVYCEGEEDPCRLPADSGSCPSSLVPVLNSNDGNATTAASNSSSSSNSTDSVKELSLKQAVVTRYYYSSVNYKCAPFPYSGCAGNQNNFLTLEDCNAKCGKPSEDVNKIRRALNSTKCWYSDKLYEVGEQIPETRRDHSCSVGCFCAEGSGTSGTVGPKITCAAVDCFPPPNRKNCVPIYKNNSCCPTDYVCEGAANTANTKNATEPFKCKFGGKEYVEGETIYPDEYPCHTCTCSPKFNGTLGTDVCREVNCGISIHYQHELVNQCEPQYYVTDSGKTLCCPIQWNCKNGQEEEE